MVMIGIALQMSPQLRDSGDRIFALCVQGFIQGRRTKSVAAVALYIACRTQSDSNKYMLIDFADILDVSSIVLLFLNHGRFAKNLRRSMSSALETFIKRCSSTYASMGQASLLLQSILRILFSASAKNLNSVVKV